ncbi:MAG: hypothetical protein K0M45_10030 [Candidatus Paracaedibacteraceae bacterium]|nr:hypothetical protein [Candidatus Paracaedibacteraceae bacterium]
MLILTKDAQTMESNDSTFYCSPSKLKNAKSLADICFPYCEKEAVSAIKKKDYKAIEVTLGKFPYNFAEKLFEDDKFSYYFIKLLELYYFAIVKFNNKITFPEYQHTSQCPAIIYNIFNRVSLKALQFMDSRAVVYDYPFSLIPSHITEYFRENLRGLVLEDGWITWELIKLFNQASRLKVKKLTINLVDYKQANQQYENLIEIARKDPWYNTLPEHTPWTELESQIYYNRKEQLSYRLQSLLEQLPNLEDLIFYDPIPAFDYSKILLALNKMTRIHSIALIGYEVESFGFPNIRDLCEQKGIKLLFLKS